MRLLRTNTLNFKRSSPDSGYIDPDTRRWVPGGRDLDVQAVGSLQPYRGKSRSVLPEGVTTSDAKVFYTKTPLRGFEEQIDQEADHVDIDGITYVVTIVEDWSKYNLTIGHFRCILVRKDKLGGQ